MQDSFAGIGKAVFPAGRHNHQLAIRQGHMLVVDPDFRGPLAHVQHFLNRVEMCRRSVARLAPLFEQAELSCRVGGGCFHPRHDAGAPFFFGLLLQIDDAHRTPHACCGSLANNIGRYNRCGCQCVLRTLPATASSFLMISGSRASGAVIKALSSARSDPTGQGSCSRGKSCARRATRRLAFSAFDSSTLMMSCTVTASWSGCQQSKSVTMAAVA